MIDFSSYLENIRQRLYTLSNVVVKDKELPYGRQFQVVAGDEKVILSVYKGKKGISTVWGGQEGLLMDSAMAAISSSSSKKSPDTNILNSEIKESISLLENCAGFNGVWVGSDESGKGDFLHGILMVLLGPAPQSVNDSKQEFPALFRGFVLVCPRSFHNNSLLF